MKRRQALLPLVLILLCPPIFSESLETELSKFNAAWLAARRVGDKTALASMMSEDCRFTSESGIVTGKAEFLSAVEPLAPDLQSRFEDLEVRSLGNDFAVMFVRLVETNRSIVGINVEFREMKLLRRSADGWKLSAIQVTLIAPSCKAINVSEADLRDYVGVYESKPNDRLEVTILGEKLFGQRTGFQKREYLPLSNAIFCANNSSGTYVFVRNPRGGIDSVQILVFGNVLTFKRISSDRRSPARYSHLRSSQAQS